MEASEGNVALAVKIYCAKPSGHSPNSSASVLSGGLMTSRRNTLHANVSRKPSGISRG